MRAFVIIAIVLATNFAVPTSRAQEAKPAAAAAVVELVELVGGGKIVNQVAGALVRPLFEAIRQKTPGMTAEHVAIVSEEVLATMRENEKVFNEDLRTIYAANFTPAEIQDLIAFYRTETGQKMVRIGPRLAQQSSQMGIEFSQKLQPLIVERVRARLKALDGGAN